MNTSIDFTSTHRLRSKALHRLLLFLAVFPIALYASDPVVIPSGWSDAFVYNNGIRTHYYRAVPAPGKPVMVMVHGITDNGLCWADVALALQEDYDIYMLDARGHGLSDPFTPEDNSNTLIKDVVGFVEAMGIEDPILMGHSMGAATVMRVGAEYPDLAKAVIMLDPILPRNQTATERPRTGRRSSPSRTENPDPLAFTMMGPPTTLVKQNNYDYEALVAKGKRENPKWSERDVNYWALSKKQYHGAYSDTGWEAMSGAMRIGNSLAEIPVKSLILKADAPQERRDAEKALVGDLPLIDMVHIDGGRHNLHHDELERTLEVLRTFLASLQ